MKTAVKIFLAIVAVLLSALILIPVLFRDRITQRVVSELNARLDAHISVGAVQLSLLRDFPHASVSVHDMLVTGKDVFAQDTLLQFSSLRVSVNWWGLLRDSGLKVTALNLEQPKLHAIVSAQGRANWDILGENQPDTTQSAPSSKNFKIQWDDVRITQGSIRYSDQQNGLEVSLAHFDLTVKGDLSQAQSDLDINATADAFTVRSGQISWISQATVSIRSLLDVNMSEHILIMKDSHFSINDLPLEFQGSVAWAPVVRTDLTFHSEESDFKTILSLIPALYQTNFEKLITQGALHFTGYIRGDITNETTPDIGAEVQVEKGMFQYTDLPEAGRNISLKALLFYDGSGEDKTYVHLEPFHMELAGNPLDARLHILTPQTNMHLSGAATGKIDFSALHQVIPLHNTTLKGMLECDMQFSGYMSDIEKEAYEKFDAKGSAFVQNFAYTPADTTGASLPVLIPGARATFTSRQIVLSSLSAQAGNTRLGLSGNVGNYFPYLFKDGTLKANLQLSSPLVDLNEWMKDAPVPPDSTHSPSQNKKALSVIEIPRNIDFTLRSSIDRLLYDNLEITGLRGDIILAGGKALLRNVTGRMLGGAVNISGSYDSRNVLEPLVDLQMDIRDFSILQTLTSFQHTLGSLFPNPENYSGNISAQLKMQSPLDKAMSPILPLLVAEGNVLSNNLSVKDAPLLRAIGKAVKDSGTYNNLRLNDLNIPFEAKDNRISVRPFKIRLNPQVNIELSGDQGFDQSLNYTVRVDVPASYLGSDVSRFLGGKQAASSRTLSLAGKVGGTLSSPIVKLDLSQTLSSAASVAADELLHRLTGPRTTTQAIPDTGGLSPEKALQARNILEEANKQAAQIRLQAKTEADKIEADASGKSSLQRAAAKVLAAATLSDAEKKAQQILSDARAKVEQMKQENR